MKTSQHLLYYVSSGDLVVTMRTGSSWPTRKYTPSVDSDAAYYVGANKTWYIIKSKFTNDWNLSDKDWAGVVTDVPLPGGGGTFNSGTGQVTTTPAYAGDVNLSGKPTLVGSYDPNNPNCKILIQNALNYLGYTDANGSKLVLDGDIGAKSQYAIKNFQHDWNLRYYYMRYQNGNPNVQLVEEDGKPSTWLWNSLKYALENDLFRVNTWNGGTGVTSIVDGNGTVYNVPNYFEPPGCSYGPAFYGVWGIGIYGAFGVVYDADVVVAYVCDGWGNQGLYISVSTGFMAGVSISAGASFIFSFANSIYDLGMNLNGSYSNALEAVLSGFGFTTGGSFTVGHVSVGVDVSYGFTEAPTLTLSIGYAPFLNLELPSFEGHQLISFSFIIPFKHKIQW